MTDVTGFMLKNAIKQWEVYRNLMRSKFEDSLWAFPGETKGDPEVYMQRYFEAEQAIARLQYAQAEYNLDVRTANNITIADAVKQIGGYIRVAALWKSAANVDSGRGLFGMNARRRSKEEEQAERQVDPDKAFAHYAGAEKVVNRLRSDIAEANATVVDITWLDQDWLDTPSI